MSHPFRTAESRFHKDLIEIKKSASVFIDLRYCGINNFMQKDLYRGFQNAFLHQVAYEKFLNALKFLEIESPHLSFRVFDALRPRSVQKIMYDYVTNTPMQEYVANPKLGSVHNFGMAIDLTLNHRLGTRIDREVDMGTEFDDFTELAQPQLEEKNLSLGKISEEQFKNRLLLRKIMEKAGFEQLPHEWWHFNALPAKHVREKFLIVE